MEGPTGSGERPGEGRGGPGGLDTRTIRLGLLALLVLAGVVFLISKLGDEDESSQETATGPIGLSEAELTDRAGEFDHPVYWVGPQPDASQYELTVTADGRVYIRYLADGSVAGDTRTHLTVGTYPVDDAESALERSAEGAGATVQESNGFKYLESGKSSAYLVFDAQPDLQIEVYDPKANKALQLAKSGAVQALQ